MSVEFIDRAAKLGYLQQSKTSNHWSAPAADSAAFKSLAVQKGTIKHNLGVTLDELLLANSNTLVKQADHTLIEGVSALKSIGWKAYVPKEQLALYLVSFFQKVTEGASTPFTKQISPVNTDLDPANNNGYLFSLAYSPSGNALADGILFENCIGNTLKFSLDNTASGAKRLLEVEVELAANAATTDKTFSGSWVAPPTNTSTYLNDKTLGFTLNITIGATELTAICWRKYSFDGNNNITNPCPTAGGKANNYRLNTTIKHTIDIPYNSSTKAILGSYKAGDNVEFDLSNGTGSTDGTIKLTCENGYLSKDPLEVQDNYHAISLEIESTTPTAGFATNYINFSDAIDWGL